MSCLHKKKKNHLHIDLNQEKLGQSLLIIPKQMQKHSFTLAVRALRVLVASPPSTDGWECHCSTGGFRTRLGLARLACHFRRSAWTTHMCAHRYLIPLLSGESKKGICVHSCRWSCTEARDDEGPDATQPAQPSCSRNLSLALPHTALTTAR